MPNGKWIDDLHAATPLADAARHVLTVRLEVVGHYLPLALRESDKDPEYVHQLRVGTRRAGAALDIFAVCLPEKVYARARKQLRRLRRAAGAARDWDVFLLGLPADGDARPGLDFLLGYALARRGLAQEHLQAAAEDYPFAFDRSLAETLAAVGEPRSGPAGQTLRDLARPLLTDLLRELDRAASADLRDYERLHRVRIAGKRLRYAMEVFAGCFAAPFREEVYPAVERMQEILGNANDSHVARQRLAGLRESLRSARPGDWKRFAPAVEELVTFHKQRLAKERRRFLRWRKRWQAAGTEAALAKLIR